jgi:16S rRNA processing protein RimM
MASRPALPPGRRAGPPQARPAPSGGSAVHEVTSVGAQFESAELPADAIEVGRIADAWGIKGWFRVLPHSASPEALFSSKRWYLQPADRSRLPAGARGEAPFSGTVRLSIKEAKDHSDTVVASAHEVPDRTAAEALRGARIFVPRSSFPTAGTNEYYWVDLIGLDVVNREGVALGQVHELLSTGPQTVLVIHEPGTDGKPVERMVPFVAAFIDNVDLPARRITVDWQPDY